MQTTQTKLHAATRMGTVRLNVHDLAREVDYYQRLGLQIHQRTQASVHLGAGAEDLLVLTERPHAPSGASKSGLYHFALLVPSRVDLGRVLRHIADKRIALGGYSDHAVSEALYLSDPEGNGIEIYRDRPRSEWEFRNGTMHITSQPLDVQAVLAAAENAPAWDGFPQDTVMGHVHLQVGDLRLAEQFYTEIIGFDPIMRYGSQAAFVSAGGYHHHLGMNTWAGRLAPRTGDELGLDEFGLVLPTREALAEVADRLRGTGLTFQQEEATLFGQDPLGINLRLTVTG